MGLIHTLPARLGFARIWRTFHTTSVPVLLLHGVLPDADTSPFNSTGKFISVERLKSFLRRIGRIFQFISMDEFLDSIAQGRRLSNVMLITFDDGYANNLEYGLPLLCDMGIPFSVFLTTGLIDTQKVLWTDLLEFAIFSTSRAAIEPGIIDERIDLEGDRARYVAIAKLKEALKSRSLSQAECAVENLCADLEVDKESPRLKDVRFLRSDGIRRMARAGVTFGGHTVSHPILSRESRERVRSEVQECKQHIEKLTGQVVRSFAYPNGRRQDYNEMVIAELIEAGYEAAFTSIHGLYRPGDSRFEIRRISVDNRWTYEEFETRCSGLLKAVRR